MLGLPQPATSIPSISRFKTLIGSISPEPYDTRKLHSLKCSSKTPCKGIKPMIIATLRLRAQMQRDGKTNCSPISSHYLPESTNDMCFGHINPCTTNDGNIFIPNLFYSFSFFLSRVFHPQRSKAIILKENRKTKC